jgi:signal transduction histidine kinase
VTHDEVVRQLAAPDAHSRLAAARRMSEIASGADRDLLRTALETEDDPWVRRALLVASSVALGAKRQTVHNENDSSPSSALGMRDSEIGSLADAAAQLLHEARRILGFIDLRASEAIGQEYDASPTKAEVDRMRKYFRSLQTLNDAGAISQNEEFVLSALLLQCVSQEPLADQVQVIPAGPADLIAVGDQGLVELVFTNGLRNALEAVATPPIRQPRAPVVVAWDETDRDYWISILDRGPGLRSDRALPFGLTTKDPASHFGAGLTIARRAAQSLGGTVALTPRDGGGMAFEFRWPTARGRGLEDTAG